MNCGIKVNSFRFIIIIFIISSFPLVSQTIERSMSSGKFEIGINQRFYKRDFSNYSKQLNWGNANLFLRYGITDWLTGSFEGFVGKIGNYGFPQRNYYSYRLGFGLGIKLIIIDNFKVMFGIHYIENLDFDRSESKYHKLQKSFITALGIQKLFNLSSLELLFFIYPAFIQDKVFDYTPNFNKSKTSVNNFGSITGVDIISYEHYHFIVEMLYANYWQPRIGVGYIF